MLTPRSTNLPVWGTYTSAPDIHPPIAKRTRPGLCRASPSASWSRSAPPNFFCTSSPASATTATFATSFITSTWPPPRLGIRRALRPLPALWHGRGKQTNVSLPRCPLRHPENLVALTSLELGKLGLGKIRGGCSVGRFAPKVGSELSSLRKITLARRYKLVRWRIP